MYSAQQVWTNVPLCRDSTFTTYFHTLSHDLRTPLNHIGLSAELMALDDHLEDSQRERAKTIVTACQELTNSVIEHLQLIEASLDGATPKRRRLA